MPKMRYTDVIHVERLVEVEAADEEEAQQKLHDGDFEVITEEQYDADPWELAEKHQIVVKPDFIYRDFTAAQTHTLLSEIVRGSRWFEVTPLPHSLYRITLKNEPGAEKLLAL